MSSEHSTSGDHGGIYIITADSSALGTWQRRWRLRSQAAAKSRSDRPFLITSRRVKGTMSSLGKRLPIVSSTNECACHPDDMARLELRLGDWVVITSGYGAVTVLGGSDPTLLAKAVTLPHVVGDLPGGKATYGANPSRLASLTENVQAISWIRNSVRLRSTSRRLSRGPCSA
jgi:anaerobic selenocysteine-containing dehydrogenase